MDSDSDCVISVVLSNEGDVVCMAGCIIGFAVIFVVMKSVGVLVSVVLVLFIGLWSDLNVMSIM